MWSLKGVLVYLCVPNRACQNKSDAGEDKHCTGFFRSESDTPSVTSMDKEQTGRGWH